MRLRRGSLTEKGFGIRSASKLALGFQSPFSVCFANLDGVAVRTAAWLICAKGTAVSLRRNEREARSAERDDGARSFFPQEKRRHPRGRNHASNQGRPTQRRFSRELEGGFYLKSRPSNVPSPQYGTGTNFPAAINCPISSREATPLSQVSPSCKTTCAKSKS